MKGMIIKLETVTVVPYEAHGAGHHCVVIKSDNPSPYGVGGYNIFVSNEELDRGVAQVLRDDPQTVLAFMDESAIDTILNPKTKRKAKKL